MSETCLILNEFLKLIIDKKEKSKYLINPKSCYLLNWSVSEFSRVIESACILNYWALVFDWYNNLASLFLLFKNFDTIAFSLSWIGEPLAQIQCPFTVKIVFSDIFVINLNFQFSCVYIELESLIPFRILPSSAMGLALELLSSDKDYAVRILKVKICIHFCRRSRDLLQVGRWWA